MSAAQIRHLEEMSNGGKPLDIRVDRTFIPADCPQTAGRKDFVTFHYKVGEILPIIHPLSPSRSNRPSVQLFVEDGRKIHQTYELEPIRIQLGVGMTLPGLDKGLVGVCKQEIRKIQVPFRLAQRAKSKGEFSKVESFWRAVIIPCGKQGLRLD